MTGAIAIFGISGRSGRELAKMATSRGVCVRGLVRSKSDLPPELASCQLTHGSLIDAGAIQEVVAESNAVCCVFGPRPPFADAFCASATQMITAVMRRVGCHRLLCLTGAMIGPATNRSAIMDWMSRGFALRYPLVAADRIEQECIVQDSDLGWTIVKPPRLTDGQLRGSVKAGVALPVGLMSKISRKDLVAFMLEEIDALKFRRMKVFVKA